MADIAKPVNRIAENFKNKTLLITGGTGFLGIILIEKILRTCPFVGKIYIIVRVNKGTDPQTRIKKMFEDPVFDLLKRTRGEEIFKKVMVIPGDISKPNLDLTSFYQKLITENAEIIYNIGASTRFDNSFKSAIVTNTISTREIIKLAKECKKLLVFVHVSTAYCFPKKRTVYEKVYPTAVNPHDIIKLVETTDDEAVEEIGKKYMSDYPNTYTFSKALSEMLVSDEIEQLPLVIARPPIVIPALEEPIPGWTNQLYGPSGLLVAAGKGILRSMYCRPNSYADVCPVDICANALLAFTYDYLTNKSRRIYNITSEIRYTWGEIIEICKKVTTTKIPLNWVVWYPGGSLKSSKFLHNACVILFHYIPAIILDSLIVLTGNKPILWKSQQKLTKASDLLEYFAKKQWDFDNDNTSEVRKLMNETEKKVYRMDVTGLDIEKYIYDAIHSIRLYVLKEGDETLPTARRHMKIMWTLDRLVRILVWIGIAYLLFQCVMKAVKYE